VNIELEVPMPHLSVYHAGKMMRLAKEIGIQSKIDPENILESLRTHSPGDLHALHTAIVNTPRKNPQFPLQSGGIYGRLIACKKISPIEFYNLQNHIGKPLADGVKILEFHYTPFITSSRPQFRTPTPGLRRTARVLLPFDIARSMNATQKIINTDNTLSDAYIYGATSTHFANFLEQSLGFHTFRNVASLKRILVGSNSVWMSAKELFSKEFQNRLQYNIGESSRYFSMAPETLEKESRIFAILQGMRQKMNISYN